MSGEELAEFDELVARHLCDALDDVGFDRLQSRLRASAECRARYLDHCRFAQEVAEVADSRGLAEAVTAFAPELEGSYGSRLVARGGPLGSRPPQQLPSVWR